MNDLVSVIIPIYNAEKYLKKAINSIQSQSYSNIEIIIIDDGSEDNSLALCRTLAGMDERIVVLGRKHSGTAGAIKAGIRASKGTYLMRVDGDDWVESSMINDLMEVAKKTDADIIQCGHFREDEAGVLIDTDDNNPFPEEGLYDLIGDSYILENLFVPKNSVIRNGLTVSMWGNLMKRDVMYPSYLGIPDYVCSKEDDICFSTCMLTAKTFYRMKKAYYHHVICSGSVTDPKNKMDFNKDVLSIESVLTSYIVNHPLGKSLIKQFGKYMFWMVNEYSMRNWGCGMKPIHELSIGKIQHDSRIVIYGAGAAGQELVAFLSSINYGNIVLWVDSKKMESSPGYEIKDVYDIQNMMFDYCI